MLPLNLFLLFFTPTDSLHVVLTNCAYERFFCAGILVLSNVERLGVNSRHDIYSQNARGNNSKNKVRHSCVAGIADPHSESVVARWHPANSAVHRSFIGFIPQHYPTRIHCHASLQNCRFIKRALICESAGRSFSMASRVECRVLTRQ